MAKKQIELVPPKDPDLYEAYYRIQEALAHICKAGHTPNSSYSCEWCRVAAKIQEVVKMLP